MQTKKSNKEPKKFDAFIRYSTLGFEMAGIICIGTFGGYKIDQWLEFEFKAFTFSLMIISVIGSIIYGIRSLLKN
jgi:hypothetical protein